MRLFLVGVVCVAAVAVVGCGDESSSDGSGEGSGNDGGGSDSSPSDCGGNGLVAPGPWYGFPEEKGVVLCFMISEDDRCTLAADEGDLDRPIRSNCDIFEDGTRPAMRYVKFDPDDLATPLCDVSIDVDGLEVKTDPPLEARRGDPFPEYDRFLKYENDGVSLMLDFGRRMKDDRYLPADALITLDVSNDECPLQIEDVAVALQSRLDFHSRSRFIPEWLDEARSTPFSQLPSWLMYFY